MRRRIHKTDAVFRHAYRTFEETPSPGVWNKISARLDEVRPENPRRFLGGTKFLLLFGLFLPSLILRNPGVEPAGIDEAVHLTESRPASPVAAYEDNLPVKQITGTRKVSPGISETKPAVGNYLTDEDLQPFTFSTVPANLPSTPKATEPVKLSKTHAYSTDLTARKLSPVFRPYWEATLFASVDHAGYHIDSDLPPQRQQDKYNIMERERNELSFSAGILLTWRFHERLGLQGGLSYSFSSIHIDPQVLFASQSPGGIVSYRYNTSAGYANIKSKHSPAPSVGDSMTTTEAKLDLHSINLPLLLQYELGNHKMKFTPAAGIAVSFMTKALLKTEMSDNSNHEKEFSERLQGTSKFYWSVMATGTVSYETGKHCKVHVTPMFRYAVSPITNNNVVETFPYSFGIAAGVTLKF